MAAEISTGNTSEISTEWRRKFAILVENEAKNVDIGPEISLPPEIYIGTKLKVLKIEHLSIILHFELSQ